MKKHKLIFRLSTFAFIAFVSFNGFAQVINKVVFKNPNQNYKVKGEDYLAYFVNFHKEKNLDISIKKISPQFNLTKINAKNFIGDENSPLGVLNGSVSVDCLNSQLDKNTRNLNIKTSVFAETSKQYFDQCNDELTNIHNTGLAGLIEYTQINYQFPILKQVQEIEFQFEDGEKLRGYIATQDNKTRPWVIIKCGIFCTVGAENGDSISTYLMNLFDQGPFNIIYLANRTGVTHIKDNNSLTMGGYLESHDLLEVARWLRLKSIFKNKVTEVHALGVSLGSSAALYASAFDEVYQKTAEAPEYFFNSVAAVCPVIDLASTIKLLTDSNSIIAQSFSYYTSKKILEVKPFLDSSVGGDIFNFYGEPSIENLYSILGELSSGYGKLWGNNLYYKRDLPKIENTDQFWELNNFAKSNLKTKIPTLIISSDDDMIVESKNNVKQLEKKINEIHNPNIGILNLAKGTHCALATAYGFSTVSTLFRNFYLNNSPIFSKNIKAKKVKYNFDFLRNHLKSGYHLRQIWTSKLNFKSVTLTFEIFDPESNYECQFGDLNSEPTTFCTKTIEKEIPFDLIGLNLEDIPKTEIEAQRLTRQLNYKIKIVNNGKIIEQTQLLPNEIEIQEL